MKPAMRIGRHYRLCEIQPRHFVELAKSCRYSPDALLATLGNLAAQVPDEASAIIAKLRHVETADEMLERLLDGRRDSYPNLPVPMRLWDRDVFMLDCDSGVSMGPCPRGRGYIATPLRYHMQHEFRRIYFASTTGIARGRRHNEGAYPANRR
jgi:hypothetical protein